LTDVKSSQELVEFSEDSALSGTYETSEGYKSEDYKKKICKKNLRSSFLGVKLTF